MALVTWFSPARGDYFTTTDPEWREPVGTVRRGRGDYRAVRWEGFVYSPDEPQPPGTVPLFHWWSASRQDNFLTTDPAWAGNVGDTRRGQGDYRLFRIEGYVSRDPGPGLIPLRQHWEGSSQDNWTTSESNIHASSGFRMYRVAGYLRPPRPGMNPTLPDRSSAASDATVADVSTGAGTGTTEASAWAGARVHSLRLIFRTGQDDKRGGSYLNPYLILHNGTRLERPRIDCVRTRSGGWSCDDFGGGTERAFVWEMDEQPRIADVARLGIQFNSTRPNPFDTPDNWDLRGLEVVATARMPDGRMQTRTLFSAAGRPLHRFPGTSSWETSELHRD